MSTSLWHPASCLAAIAGKIHNRFCVLFFFLKTAKKKKKLLIVEITLSIKAGICDFKRKNDRED